MDNRLLRGTEKRKGADDPLFIHLRPPTSGMPRSCGELLSSAVARWLWSRRATALEKVIA